MMIPLPSLDADKETHSKEKSASPVIVRQYELQLKCN